MLVQYFYNSNVIFVFKLEDDFGESCVCFTACRFFTISSQHLLLCNIFSICVNNFAKMCIDLRCAVSYMLSALLLLV